MRIGQLVADRYEIEELVGVGGMSTVFRARDTILERPVALKVLHEDRSTDPEYVTRFRREARAIAKLSHPNIVTVIDRGEFDGREFIVFEHIAGENLKELVERAGPLPVEQALVLAHQAARGLAFAHENGVVHRDVKPQNILVNEDGVAKVTDFGIARSLEREEEAVTAPGTVVGTSDYIAPEQAAGKDVDGRSDQYSLGALLYELLTGEVPYPGESFVTVALRHLNDPVPSVRTRRPDVSPRVEAVVRRAMAKRPEDRFPSTDAFIAALEACLAEERASRDGVTEVIELPSPARPRRSARTAISAAAIAAGALLALAVAAALLTGRDTEAPPPEAGEETRTAPAAPPAAAPVRLRAVSDFDPEGDGREHPGEVGYATDGDLRTYWTTETYQDFAKSGVGIVLDAGRPAAPARLVVLSDEPGFTALVRAGSAPRGPFETISDEQTATSRTTFELETRGSEYRYYVIWITDPNGRAHVNEIRPS